MVQLVSAEPSFTALPVLACSAAGAALSDAVFISHIVALTLDVRVRSLTIPYSFLQLPLDGAPLDAALLLGPHGKRALLPHAATCASDCVIFI